MSSSTDSETDPISDQDIYQLSSRQKGVYLSKLSWFEEYLREEGKDPNKGIGYADKSVNVRVSRLHRLMTWIWDDDPTTDLNPSHADDIVSALNSDTLRKRNGDRYSEGSKRKFVNTLQSWFTFKDLDWHPKITFSDGKPEAQADPFSKRELERLWESSLRYEPIPSYNNLTPAERSRWRRYIANDLGKPTEDVSPDDWNKVNSLWEVPSLIRTVREAGWRPDLIERMPVNWYDASTHTIIIPAGEAPKNDSSWNQKLTNEAAYALEQWLEQRKNIERYDDSELIWLTREGNPMSSGPLNRLLRNLMEEAEIKPAGRNLVWYSFRHSIGTYLYYEYKDLKIVANTLRQESIKSADIYVDDIPELKREAAEIM